MKVENNISKQDNKINHPNNSIPAGSNLSNSIDFAKKLINGWEKIELKYNNDYITIREKIYDNNIGVGTFP